MIFDVFIPGKEGVSHLFLDPLMRGEKCVFLFFNVFFLEQSQ